LIISIFQIAEWSSLYGHFTWSILKQFKRTCWFKALAYSVFYGAMKTEANIIL